ncbi:MAG: ABC transporter permease [Anaerolineae bacterium]|nr:ABC transporter permease [Anaerolineae bacterium]
MASPEAEVEPTITLPRSSAAEEYTDRWGSIYAAEPESFWWSALRQLRRDKLTLLAFAVLGLIALMAIFAGVISEHILGVNPNATELLATFEGPSREHWLGTDQIGRDQLSRLLYGARISLSIGVLGTAVAISLGVLIGISAGYFGGRVDDAIMWFINTVSSIPTFFLLLIVAALFRLSPASLVLLFGLLGWIGAARIVRGQVFSIKEREYVLAARAMGSTDFRIMLRHILPNVVSILIIVTVRDIGILILSESALSFLGLGVQPPTATWGSMLSKSQQYFRLGPHLVIFPGLLITFTVLSLYLIGDGLRDALDPRLR